MAHLAQAATTRYAGCVKTALALLALLSGCATSLPRPIPTDQKPRPIDQQTSTATSGPTLNLQAGGSANSINELMYFVKLISPEPVQLSVDRQNTQRCRMLAIDRRRTSDAFHARCQFEILGTGTQQSLFDQGPAIRRNHERLQRGEQISLQLGFIKISGAGQGDILVEGEVSEGQQIVNRISLNFSARGAGIPVTIGINDISYIDGKPHAVNEQVIAVDSLDFHRQGEQPKMHVTLNSMKSAAAGDGLLSNLMGKVKGAVVNMLIPPVPILRQGNDAMLDFAQAIVDGKSSFTFPLAK